MGLRFVLDTNAVLFHFGGRLASPLPLSDSCISVMSWIELLSYPDITVEEEREIRGFLGRIEVVPLTDDIIESTVRLRREHRLRVPDAVIAATARVLGRTLISNDNRLLGLPNVTVEAARLRT